MTSKSDTDETGKICDTCKTLLAANDQFVTKSRSNSVSSVTSVSEFDPLKDDTPILQVMSLDASSSGISSLSSSAPSTRPCSAMEKSVVFSTLPTQAPQPATTNIDNKDDILTKLDTLTNVVTGLALQIAGFNTGLSTFKTNTEVGLK